MWLNMVEIVLAVVAWRKGWRWRALLHLGRHAGVALLIGMGDAVTGEAVKHTAPVPFLVILVCIGMLIRMVLRAPQSA